MRKLLFLIILIIISFIIFYKLNFPKLLTKSENRIENSVQLQFDWQNFLPEIKSVIIKEFPNLKIEETHPLFIYKTVDITGDGISEALINLGSGGAYISYLTLIKLENNKPFVAQFKQKDGKISTRIFLVGTSVMNGADIEMISGKNLIYSLSWHKDENGNLKECDIEVYIWNQKTKIFEYSEKESREIKEKFCRNLENKNS